MKASIFTLSLLSAALSYSVLSQAAQQDAKGFVEDSQLTGQLRNYYRNNDYRNLDSDGREWAQGLQLDYQSGYTQGQVGFGIDAHAYFAAKLDSGGGRARTKLLVSDHSGESEDSSALAGGAVKMRVSNTELKYGDLRPYNPVIALADSRLMPATATGFAFNSQELEGLMLEGGHFTSARDFNQTGRDSGFYAGYAGVEGGDVDFLGGTYQAHPQLALGLYTSLFEDVWRQHYINLNFDQPLDQAAYQNLNLDFNLYRSLDEGKALAGDIDVTAWSLALAYRLGPQTFTVAHQRIEGDMPFDYLVLGGGGFHDSIYLANSSLIADFNGPEERSWSLRYKLDFSTFGVPGLSFTTRYIRGDNVEGDRVPVGSPYRYYADNEKHWERDVDVRYVVQAGVAKDLSFMLRQGTHRISGTSDGNVDHIRLITEYPFNLF